MLLTGVWAQLVLICAEDLQLCTNLVNQCDVMLPDGRDVGVANASSLV